MFLCPKMIYGAAIQTLWRISCAVLPIKLYNKVETFDQLLRATTLSQIISSVHADSRQTSLALEGHFLCVSPQLAQKTTQKKLLSSQKGRKSAAQRKISRANKSWRAVIRSFALIRSGLPAAKQQNDIIFCPCKSTQTRCCFLSPAPTRQLRRFPPMFTDAALQDLSQPLFGDFNHSLVTSKIFPPLHFLN